MASLVESVVVDVSRLVEQHLLASCLDRRHHLLVLCSQVVHVELLLLDEEQRRGDTYGGMSLALKLEHIHALIVARREVVQRWVRGHDPVPIGVLSRSVDAQPSLHVPEPHGTIF